MRFAISSNEMEEETEILASIYPDDIVQCNLGIDGPIFEITIRPTDTDNFAEHQQKQPIRLNLITLFTKNYPLEIPEFKFKSVRGIADVDLVRFLAEVKAIATRNLGTPVLFEIIQYVRDELSDYGPPKTANCVICLSEFDESEKKITNLECFHYFHTECLCKHVEYVKNFNERERNEALKNKLVWNERPVGCPVCRVNLLALELDQLTQFKKEHGELFANKVASIGSSSSRGSYKCSDKMKKLQIEMHCLFERQKRAGGIIDLTESDTIVLMDRPVPVQQEGPEKEYEVLSIP
jgi:hypothetical protein